MAVTGGAVPALVAGNRAWVDMTPVGVHRPDETPAHFAQLIISGDPNTVYRENVPLHEQT